MNLDKEKEYATALFQLGLEEKSEKKYKQSLEIIKNVLNKNPEYLDFLSSPYIPVKERFCVIEQAFGETLSIEIIALLKILCRKNQVYAMPKIIEIYNKMLNDSMGISVARVLSAVELTADEKVLLKHKLEKLYKKTIIPEFSVAPSILGGLVIEIDGKTLDSSVRRKLKDIKEVIGR